MIAKMAQHCKNLRYQLQDLKQDLQRSYPPTKVEIDSIMVLFFFLILVLFDLIPLSFSS